jgi:hypothetical protein
MKVSHESYSNFLRSYDGETDEESYFHNKLNLQITFHPSDNARVLWRVRGLRTQRWGADRFNISTLGFYGELEFDFGKFRIGRGITRDYLYLFAFDNDPTVDGISFKKVWRLDGGNTIGLSLFYEKMGSNIANTYRGIDIGNYPDLFSHWPDPLTRHKDIDSDIYGFDASYKWATGGVSFGMEYDRNMTDSSVKKDWALYFNPAFYQVFGKIILRIEGKYGIGKRIYDKNLVYSSQWKRFEDEYLGHPWDGTLKNRGMGVYVDLSYNHNAGNISLVSWYVSGTDINGRGHLNSLVDLGHFSPYLVAYCENGRGSTSCYDALGERWLSRNVPSVFNFARINSGTRNHYSIGITGYHQLVPDQIKFNYAFGYFRLIKPAMIWIADDTGYHAAPYLVNGSTESFRYQSKDLGYELDLGFTFEILKNVRLETNFGYFFNGDAFDYYDKASSSFKPAKDTFYWQNIFSIYF